MLKTNKQTLQVRAYIYITTRPISRRPAKENTRTREQENKSTSRRSGDRDTSGKQKSRRKQGRTRNALMSGWMNEWGAAPKLSAFIHMWEARQWQRKGRDQHKYKKERDSDADGEPSGHSEWIWYHVSQNQRRLSRRLRKHTYKHLVERAWARAHS